MNLRTVALICHEGITSVEAYWFDRDGGRKSGNYTFACPVEIATNLCPGDVAVVEYTNGYSLCRIDAVHDEPQFDPDAAIEYKLIVQKVDRTRVDEIESELVVAMEQLQNHRTRSIRQQILGQFGISSPQELFRGLPHNTTEETKE